MSGLSLCLVLCIAGGAYSQRALQWEHGGRFIAGNASEPLWPNLEAGHILPSKPKIYKGSVTAKIFGSLAMFNADTKSYGAGVKSKVSQSEQPRRQRKCFRCPGNKTVVAKKGRSSVIMADLNLKPCVYRSTKIPVRLKVLRGPHPGSVVPQGSHTVVAKLITGNHKSQICRFQYIVVVKSCPVPVAPIHGLVSCEQTSRFDHGLPDGTRCRYSCLPGYSVPSAQRHLVTTVCRHGVWSNTQDPQCLEDGVKKNAILKKARSSHGYTMRNKRGCRPGMCKNGGTCHVLLSEPRCNCSPGFTGPRCTKLV